MRYVINSSNCVLAVSFGSTILYSGIECTEYTGSVPSGWKTLEEWYEDEGGKLWRWKIIGGNLTLDSSAVAPEEGQWGVPDLQSKTITDMILTETTITADEDYDGLESVTIGAQPCGLIRSYRSNQTSVSGKVLTVSTMSGLQIKPKAIALASNYNFSLSAAHTTVYTAFLELSGGAVTRAAAIAKNNYSNMIHDFSASGWSVNVKNGSIEISSPYNFDSGDRTGGYYECYLMY